MKRTILAIALALTFGTAYASNNNSGTICNGNGSCDTGGGTATATATATGGSVGDIRNTNTNTNLNNNANTNLNTNVNTLGQHQGQLQGQNQSQKQGQTQGQGQGQNQTATGGTATNNGNAQSTNVNVENKVPRQAVPGIAPATSTTAVCMVGYSGGIGTPVGGISLGGAKRDEICSMLDTGKTLVNVGLHTGDEAMIEEGKTMLRDAASKLRNEFPTADKTAKAPVKDTTVANINATFQGY